MGRYRLSLRIVLVVALVLTVSAASAQKALLRYNYRAGEEYTSQMSSEQDIEQQIGNQNVRVKQTMLMRMDMEVKSVDADGAAELEVTYGRIALKQDSPMANIDYDSADAIKKDVQHPALIGFKALVGRTVTMKMSSRGEVMEVKGLKEIAEAVLAEVPAGPDREAARRQLGVMFDEKNYGERMGGLNLVYPEEPVGVGDSWNKEQKISMGFINMIVKTTYTIKAVGNTVDVDLNSTIGPGDAPDPGLGLTTTIDKGVQKGLTKVQRNHAGLMSGELTQDLKMTINIQGRSIKQTMKATTSYAATRK